MNTATIAQQPCNYIGIDVSKDWLDAVLLTSGACHRIKVDQTDSGYTKLVRWAKKNGGNGTFHVCMEATGRYSTTLALFLVAAGYVVSVVNPYLIKCESGAQGQGNKTDPKDALTIAIFCRDKKPDPTPQAGPTQQEIKDLVRYRQDLIAQRQQSKNRVDQPGLSNEVVKSLRRVIEQFDKELKSIEEILDKTVTQDAAYAKANSLILSIPGLGPVAAQVILSEAGLLDHCPSARSLAAFAGLNPRRSQSGKATKATHISRWGSSLLRKVMYMAVRSAIRYNPIIKAFAKRLKDRGMAAKAVDCAAMRKLLMIVYGVVKSGTPFAPDYGASVTG